MSAGKHVDSKATVAERLRALDERQGQGADNDLALYDAYCEVAEHLGTSTPADLQRVAWLVDRPFPTQDALLPTMRAVEHSVAEPATSALARLYIARHALDRNDLEAADPLFREVLRESRNIGPLVEAAACLHYARQCTAEERIFEALVLARHAAAIYGRESRPWELALAQTDLCWSRTELGNWEGGEQAAQTGMALLPSLPTKLTLPVALLISVHRAAAAIGQGDTQRALELTDEIESRAGEIAKTSNKVRWFAGFRADVHAKAGRFRMALELIDSIRHLMGDDRTSFYVELIDVRCLAGLGRLDEARSRATPLLARLADGRELLGARGWIDQSVALAEVLEDPCADLGGSKRAYDIAATAMVSRILELDRAVRDIPQLGFTDASDIAVLARSRWAFTEQQDRMTNAVRRMLERAARAGAENLVPMLDPTVVGRRVCAWCGKIGTPEGNWLPIAQYLPEAQPSRLTHGICPTCGTKLEAEFAG